MDLEEVDDFLGIERFKLGQWQSSFGLNLFMNLGANGSQRSAAKIYGTIEVSMASSLPSDTTDVNPTNNNRRQLSTTLQRIRRQAMTEERRQEYLSRRRTNYQQRRYGIGLENSNVNVSNVAPNSSENDMSRRRENRRIFDRQRRNVMTDEQRTTHLARRREAYRRRNQHSTPSSREGTDEDMVQQQTIYDHQGIAATTVSQVCRTHTLPYQMMTTNFEQGSTSTCQRLTDLNHQGTGNSENNIIVRPQQCLRPRRYHNLARNFNESQHNDRWHMSNPTICLHCHALLFHGETAQLCCKNGRTKLDPISSPIELQQLYDDDSDQGRHFMQHIRAYNHVFSFTSMGVNIDESLATGANGIYTFRAHGSIYHSIGSLLPNENCRPRYMQMWIVDTDHEIDNRLQENQGLRRELLVKIQNILDQYNPFVHVFRQIGQREDLPSCKLIIKEQQPNQHQYNLPTASQVAAVIVDNECPDNFSSRDIIIQGIGGNLMNIQDIVGYYDPLQYPLLLPYGTYGWDTNSRNIDGTRVTCLNYYAYMLQIRANSSSLLLRGGRLLQQYVVDNYVKIETHRLRWIRTNQHNIRSDLYQGLQDCLDGGENNAGQHSCIVQVDAIAKYQRNELWLNARLHMPIRTQIIGLGWKITIPMKTYDFGRLILRIFRKLKRHTAKRIGWIEGWDLTKKGIAARRQIEEKTLFRKKIRPANDVDIKMFYHRRADQARANFS